MSGLSTVLLPFYGQYPAGYVPPATTDIAAEYPDGIGGSQTLSFAQQDSGQAIAAWLLANSELGGFQTGVQVFLFSVSP